MPDAAAKRGDKDFISGCGIGNDAMSPFEIKAGDASPVFTTVGRSPRRRFEARGVKNFRVARVDGDIVNVAIFFENLTPCFSCILRQVDAATIAVDSRGARPSGEIKTLRIIGINRQPVWCVTALRHGDSRPILGSVRGRVKGAVFIAADAAVLGAARQQYV